MKLFKNQTFQIKVSKELEELEAEQNVKNSIILTKLFTIVGFQNILGFKLSQPNQHIHINIHALDPLSIAVVYRFAHKEWALIRPKT